MNNVKNWLAATTLALAGLGLASSASAQSFSPSSGTYSIASSNMQLHQTVGPITCGLTGTAVLSSSSGGAINSANFGLPNPLCLVLVEHAPWNIEPVYLAGGVKGIRVHVSLTAVNSTCTGYIEGAYVPDALSSTKKGVLTIPYQKVVGSNSPDCHAGGTITITGTGTTPQLVVI